VAAVSELIEPDDDATAARATASPSPRARTSLQESRCATVGVENLVIIDTSDAVLVAHRDHLQRVKKSWEC
jgi:mannose-1-phosphate guanylyltransferase